MNFQAEKLQLIQNIIKLEDEAVLEKIQELLFESFQRTLKPMTQEALLAKLDASEKAIREGDVMTQDALKELVKNNWKK